jgi:hypothetical protein
MVSPNGCRIESGLMVGPLIFPVGTIIYGAALNSVHQEIVNTDEAVSALKRIKVEGGLGSSISYKNYNMIHPIEVREDN